jgi:hypothetical protein
MSEAMSSVTNERAVALLHVTTYLSRPQQFVAFAVAHVAMGIR